MSDYELLKNWITQSDYIPETSIENIIWMILNYFDNEDNYGKYDCETGCGGYGDEFSIEKCKQYVEDSGGFREFDYYC